MSAMEKLFEQIFERKNWIVDQVRHQAHLFDQHLASTLLIDGVAPPPWLLHSQPSSLPRGFQREELITELLQPQPQYSVPCSIGQHPVYDKPMLTADTRGFPADLCTDFCTLQETGEASSKLSLLHEIPKGDTAFVLNDASEADPNITSPQHQRHGILSEAYHDLDQSLARVQRSKARQKAFEFRNSAKASGSCLREKDHIVDPSRSAAFGFAPPLSEDVFSAELVKSSHTISDFKSTEEAQMVNFKSKENQSKSSSCSEMRTLISGSSLNGLLEMDAPCSIDLEVQGQSEGERGDFFRKEKGSNTWCREITRPHKLTKNCQMNEALKSNSYLHVGKNSGTDKPMQPVSWVDNSMELNRSDSMHGSESRDCQINGHQITVGSCEIKQLRCSSHQPNCEELPGLEISSHHGDVKTAGSSGKPAQSPQDDDSGNGNANITEDFLVSGCSLNQLRPTHSDPLITDCTHYLRRAHSTTPSGQSNLSDNVDPERCTTVAAQSSVAFEKPPEGSSLGIPSNTDPADLKKVPEVLASSLCSDSNILLKPEQLDFDDRVENWSRLNNVPGAVSEESVEDAALSKRLLTSLEQVKSFEELELSSHLSEKPVDKIGQISTFIGQDDEIVVSETCGNDEDVIPNYPLQGETSKSGMSFIDRQYSACTSLPCTLHDEQYSSISSLKSNRSLNTPHEKDTREFDAAESTELDLGRHKVDTDSYGGQVMPMELISSVTSRTPHFDPILENVTCFKYSDHQSAKRLLVQSEGNGFANSSPQLDKSTELSPASLSLQMNPLHSTNENFGKRKAIRAEDDEKTHFSSMTGSTVDRGLNNLTQHNAKHDVMETFESLQLQQILKDVTLEGQHEDTGTHLVHENHGQPDSIISGLSGAASVARLEGTVDKEVQCLTEDIFKQTDEEYRACFENGEDHLTDEEYLACFENREAHIQRKYKSLHHSSCGQSLEQIRKDQIMPVFEGFFMPTNDEKLFSNNGFIFEKLDVQNGSIEHASIQKLLSKSASVHTPLSHFSTAYKLHKSLNLYKSVPNGLLEYMDIGRTFSMNECDGVNILNKEVEQAPYGRSHSDCLPLSYAESAGYQKKTYTSPVGKLWNMIASKSGSSKEKRSLNPELPCISEENENADDLADKSKEDIDLDVRTNAANRKPLADITEDPNCLASVSDTENEMTRCNLDSIKTELSFAGTHKKAKQKPGKQESSKRHRVKRPLEVPNNRFSKPKSSLRKGGPGISEMDSKRDNIVSHMTSFLPLVQQKQTTAPFTGKRDIKVRALEAAEAAKRQAEKKEIERKMKKEALKLERARHDKENMRQLELQRKRKVEEQKQKLVDIAMKKRQREEEERREKEIKRKRVEGARRNQENREHMATKKEQQGPKYHAAKREELGNELRKKETLETEQRGAFPGKVLESEAELDQGICSKPCATEQICVDETNKAITILQTATVIEDSVSNGNQEQSYEISPYKCSDDEDEDEDEDDTPNNKFVPSWASKSRMARAISSQQRVDPDVIFPPDSFCSISEVVMPQKFQLK